MPIFILDWTYWNVSKRKNKLQFIVDSSFLMLHHTVVFYSDRPLCLLFSLIWMGHQFSIEHCTGSLDSLPQWVSSSFRESERDEESAIVRNCTIVSGGMCLPFVSAANKTFLRMEKRMWRWTIQQKFYFETLVILGQLWHEYIFLSWHNVLSLYYTYIILIFDIENIISKKSSYT